VLIPLIIYIKQYPISNPKSPIAPLKSDPTFSADNMIPPIKAIVIRKEELEEKINNIKAYLKW